jgi:preprotein translocase subunit SecD
VAPPAGTLRVGRYFLALIAILAVIYGLVFLPGKQHSPKLGLDLVGGKQVVFQAKTDNGKAPSKGAMSQARQIMEDRVNGSGVANAEVVVQGGNQIAVSIPGKNSADIAKLGEAAKLNFRPLVMAPVATAAASASAQTPSTGATPTTTPSGSTSPAAPTTPAGSSPSASSSNSPRDNAARPLDAPSTPASPSGTPTSPKASTTPGASTTPSPTAAPSSAAPVKTTADPLKGLSFAVPTSDTAFNKLTQAQQQELQARLATFDCSSDQPDGAAQETKPFLACDNNDPTKATSVFLLGPVIVPGTEISSATANPPDFSGNGGSAEWTVSLNLKSSGSKAWAKYTGAHNTGGQDISTPITSCGPSGTPCANYVAFTLDGAVVSSPYNKDAINGQATQISGSFTEDSANLLARELKYGALPLNFTPLTNTDVSATLGTAQLKAGLLAGGIGLVLVILYSLFYYRALGLVTIASLMVSGVLTWGSLVILGREVGFTLTLAGIAGFIVAIGITADSFVVFFERIKDEVHEGRSMRVAVPRAWVRARRTILSADTVSFLAAAVLYYFAAGDVKGFAFTLGLSTILDLVVVFLFTHPMVSLLSRSAAFGSSRFTGLNAVRSGGIVPDEPAPATKPAPAAQRARRAKVAPKAEAQPAAVAVLDEEDEPDAPPPDEVDTVEDVAPPAPKDEPTAKPDRPRTPPKAGTAAERAAERRARMRAEAADSQKGKR